MKQIYLNATDEVAFLELCEAQGLLDDDGNLVTSSLSPIRYDLVTFPNLSKPTGETLTDEKGNEYPEVEVIDGFCAMALVQDDYEVEFLADIQVTPTNPVVSFSGYGDNE